MFDLTITLVANVSQEVKSFGNWIALKSAGNNVQFTMFPSGEIRSLQEGDTGAEREYNRVVLLSAGNQTVTVSLGYGSLLQGSSIGGSTTKIINPLGKQADALSVSTALSVEDYNALALLATPVSRPLAGTREPFLAQDQGYLFNAQDLTNQFTFWTPQAGKCARVMGWTLTSDIAAIYAIRVGIQERIWIPFPTANSQNNLWVPQNGFNLNQDEVLSIICLTAGGKLSGGIYGCEYTP